MDNKILVTGGDGRFAKVLKSKNEKLNLIFCSKKQLDILNLKSIKKNFDIHKPKIIFHCAGLSRPMDIHEKDIVRSIDLNIIGTANLVKICKLYKIKLIYFSTGYVYEGKKGSYKETDAVKPFNNYGLSKLGGECAVSMYKNSLILRITMTEKPFAHNTAFTNLKSNFMFHEDLVYILPNVINEIGIINIGGKSQSVYNFAKNYNKSVKKAILNKNLKFPFNQTMNLSKLKKLIKW